MGPLGDELMNTYRSSALWCHVMGDCIENLCKDFTNDLKQIDLAIYLELLNPEQCSFDLVGHFIGLQMFLESFYSSQCALGVLDG